MVFSSFSEGKGGGRVGPWIFVWFFFWDSEAGWWNGMVDGEGIGARVCVRVEWYGDGRDDVSWVEWMKYLSGIFRVIQVVSIRVSYHHSTAQRNETVLWYYCTWISIFSLLLLYTYPYPYRHRHRHRHRHRISYHSPFPCPGRIVPSFLTYWKNVEISLISIYLYHIAPSKPPSLPPSTYNTTQ